MQHVGVVDGAIGGPEQLTALAALFPHVGFGSVGPVWPESGLGDLDILVVAADSGGLDETLRRLKKRPSSLRVVVVLRDADVGSTRRLVREGAADVLPAPVSEPALALCLERLLVTSAAEAGDRPKTGEVVAFLKAGGGVGATALIAQMAAMLSARGEAKVCVADLDLQFGVASLYLDLPEAITIADLLGAASSLGEAPMSDALATHGSGARLLAAPRELMPLETLAASQIDGLIRGLRRDFPLTLIDLPSVWTAWTNRVVTLADRIVLVTHLSVPHIQLVKRQFNVLATQQLDSRPLTLACNNVSAEQLASVSIKAAEKALGRSFDVVIPEDRRTMTAAINQGLELAAVRRGTKLEKAIAQLADKVAGGVIASAPARSRW